LEAAIHESLKEEWEEIRMVRKQIKTFSYCFNNFHKISYLKNHLKSSGFQKVHSRRTFRQTITPAYLVTHNIHRNQAKKKCKVLFHVSKK